MLFGISLVLTDAKQEYSRIASRNWVRQSGKSTLKTLFTFELDSKELAGLRAGTGNSADGMGITRLVLSGLPCVVSVYQRPSFDELAHSLRIA